ncbi:prolipoprotein diacylglyceryl transferase [bacterium]|nr:prolipoprotein diacylglyceryl transferase [bacterium]
MPFPNISPIAFYFLGLPVRWYALAYIAGFLISFYLIKYFLRHNTNNTVSYRNLDDLFTYMIFGIILGGRLGYVLFYNFTYYLSNPLEILQIWHGGMSFHGGLIGSITALFLWCKRYKKNFLYMSDILCTCAPIGLFFGRIANFINGELYGRITTSKLGIIFPNTNGLPRYPSQLFEALTEGLILFIILMCLRRLKNIRNRYGLIAFIFVGGYAISRIIVENFREPDEQIGFISAHITMGQILSTPMLLLSIGGIIYLLKRKPREELFITSPLLNDSTFATHRFFTRNGGVSSGVFASANCKFETSDNIDNVKKNREILLSSIGINANTSLITLNQRHTDKVVLIDTQPKNVSDYLNIEADALLCSIPNVAIGILTADCVPVILIDESKKIVGAVHCGWQGIYNDIIKSVANELKKLNSNPEEVKVALGPCLKQKSYEVDFDFKDKIVAQNKSFETLFKLMKNKNKYLFDCTKYCIMKLKAEGFKTIETLDFDTYTEKDLFFSYRRSIITKDFATSPIDEGRILSVITIKK